jgi:hypothetical protein
MNAGTPRKMVITTTHTTTNRLVLTPNLRRALRQLTKPVTMSMNATAAKTMPRMPTSVMLRLVRRVPRHDWSRQRRMLNPIGHYISATCWRSLSPSAFRHHRYPARYAGGNTMIARTRKKRRSPLRTVDITSAATAVALQAKPG